MDKDRTMDDETVRRVSSRLYEDKNKERYDPYGRSVAQDFLESTLGMIFDVLAVKQKEMYTIYDFVARNGYDEIVSFEVEVRPSVDLVRNVCFKNGHNYYMSGIHFPYRKDTSRADFFLSISVPNLNLEIEQAVVVFDRFAVLGDSIVEISEVNCDDGSVQYDFFFNVDRNLATLYVKRNGIWEILRRSVLSFDRGFLLRPTYNRWVSESKEAYDKKKAYWNGEIDRALNGKSFDIPQTTDNGIRSKSMKTFRKRYDLGKKPMTKVIPVAI